MTGERSLVVSRWKTARSPSARITRYDWAICSPACRKRAVEGTPPALSICFRVRLFARSAIGQKTEVVGVRGKERDTVDRVDWIDDYETGKTVTRPARQRPRALRFRPIRRLRFELEKMIGSLDATGRREALHLLGLSWYGIGDFARSAECFRKYLSLGETRGPDAATATFLLAMSLSSVETTRAPRNSWSVT